MAGIPEDWPQEIRAVFAGVCKGIPIVDAHRGSDSDLAEKDNILGRFYLVRTEHTTLTRRELLAITACPLFSFLTIATASGLPMITFYFEMDA